MNMKCSNLILEIHDNCKIQYVPRNTLEKAADFLLSLWQENQDKVNYGYLDFSLCHHGTLTLRYSLRDNSYKDCLFLYKKHVGLVFSLYKVSKQNWVESADLTNQFLDQLILEEV